jgi:hypothetical protein
MTAVDTIRVRPVLSTKELNAEWRAKPATDDHYDQVVDRDADVYDEETGKLLLRFRKGVIPDEHVRAAADAWMDIDEREPPSVTRASAAGELNIERLKEIHPRAVGYEPAGAYKCHLKLDDGRVLKATVSNPVYSYLAGYGINRYLNQAVKNRLTNHFPERWHATFPFWQSISATHKMLVPDVHASQLARIQRHPKWIIPGTAMSTSTLNINYESHYHYDVGDFKSGFSTITVIERGRYTGGLLVFPQYRIAVDVRTGDVGVKQSHLHMHGNTRLVQETPGAKRLSFITYLKHKLADVRNRLDDPDAHDDGWRDGVKILENNRDLTKRLQVHKAKRKKSKGTAARGGNTSA